VHHFDGTTISPYLMFWQSSQEVEEIQQHADARPLKKRPRQAPQEFRRIRIDTFTGMAVSNIVAIAIMMSTAATLHAQGKTDITTAADAAEVLKPIAGDLAFALFSLGIIGTGLLSLPRRPSASPARSVPTRRCSDAPGLATSTTRRCR
jgi:Mn2+/Fe2+ NRAMP family transporter